MHSEAFTENGIDKVRVYLECPAYEDFESAEYLLLDYKWKNDGISEESIEHLKEYLRSEEKEITARAKRIEDVGGEKLV